MNDSDKSKIENFKPVDKNVQNVPTRGNDSHKSEIEKYAEKVAKIFELTTDKVIIYLIYYFIAAQIKLLKIKNTLNTDISLVFHVSGSSLICIFTY